MTLHNPPRLLRRRAMEAMTGLPRSTLYDRIQAGDFPRPVRLGPGAVAWRAEEVELWISSRPVAA